MGGVDTFEEVPIFQAAKRCGLRWCPWMGDWYTSWSPKSNGDGEGPWGHWANLAAMILSDPRTQAVAPHLYRPDLTPDKSVYTESVELPKHLRGPITRTGTNGSEDT